MKNEEKNQKVGNKRPPKGRLFSSKNQPSSKQKSEGWDRRRERQRIVDTILKYQNMNVADFQALLVDVKDHPENYTLAEASLLKYASDTFNDPKVRLDWINRHLSYAPTELTGEDGVPLINKIKVNIINKHETFDDESGAGNTGNECPSEESPSS